MLEQYVKKILTSRVYDVAVETPLQPARQLSERLGNRILLKREDLQPVYSFKIRGAYNKLTQLSDAERACGVVTASAGNHAQGLALAAKVLGVKATIVMPKTTPEIKVEGVRSRGGRVVLHGDSFPEALAYSLKLVDEKGYVYIHPYPLPEGAFYHVDLYRIQEVEKLKMIGMEELLFDPTNILAIEWPEILAAAYPNLPDRNILHIHILKHEKDQRTILIGKKRDA